MRNVNGFFTIGTWLLASCAFGAAAMNITGINTASESAASVQNLLSASPAANLNHKEAQKGGTTISQAEHKTLTSLNAVIGASEPQPTNKGSSTQSVLHQLNKVQALLNRPLTQSDTVQSPQPEVHTLRATSLPKPVVNAPLAIPQLQTGPAIEKTNIQLGHKLIRNIPVNANYALGKVNYISSVGVNALVSPVKIASFVPEPGKVTFKWINDNRGIVFQLRSPAIQSFQAMVTFDNGKPPLSLVFTPIRVAGRVIALPSRLTGTAPLKPALPFGTSSAYDTHIIHYMTMAMGGAKFSDAWQASTQTHVLSPYTDFKLPKEQIWSNSQYTLKKYEVCSTLSSPLILSEQAFTGKLAKDAMAVTVSTHKLLPHQCGYLVILSASTAPFSSTGAGPSSNVLGAAPSQIDGTAEGGAHV